MVAVAAENGPSLFNTSLNVPGCDGLGGLASLGHSACGNTYFNVADGKLFVQIEEAHAGDLLTDARGIQVFSRSRAVRRRCDDR